MDRATSCILSWRVDWHRTEVLLQEMLDESVPSAWYYSDLMPTYKTLFYHPGTHTPMPDKSQTFRVEGVNAELRHYLARLTRRSRCFSRCVMALRRSIKLFVFAWNARQLYRHQHHHRYPAHLCDFAYPH